MTALHTSTLYSPTAYIPTELRQNPASHNKPLPYLHLILRQLSSILMYSEVTLPPPRISQHISSFQSPTSAVDLDRNHNTAPRVLCDRLPSLCPHLQPRHHRPARAAHHSSLSFTPWPTKGRAELLTVGRQRAGGRVSPSLVMMRC